MDNHSIEVGEESVSPVIATILMVAVTVVLAGIMYSWASQLASNQPELVTLNSYETRDAVTNISDGDSDALINVNFFNAPDNLKWPNLRFSITSEAQTGKANHGTVPSQDNHSTFTLLFIDGVYFCVYIYILAALFTSLCSVNDLSYNRM